MGLKSEDAYTTELQTILRVAHALRDAAGVSIQLGNDNSRNLHTVIDSINLPTPHPLLPALLEAGFSHDISASIDKAYQLRAEELQQRIQQSIIMACREIAELPVVPLAIPPDGLMRKLIFTFTELYLRRLEQWKQEIVKRGSKTSTKVASKNFRAFNQEFVPLLEHFFEENAFPTHADKMFLANKSNMEYRQIHVWFQNRRNRTKKEGKVLRKKPTHEGATKPSEKLYELMKCQMVDSGPQAPERSGEGTVEVAPANLFYKNINKPESQSNMLDTFISFSPPHAFPSSYPPTCHYDPFPCKTGASHLGKPEWRCVPRRKNPPTLSASMDDLVEMFSRLSVRDGARSKGSPKLQSHAATAAITVVPSRAPHPSLIVHKYSPPMTIVTLRSSASGPVSCPTAFQTPSPTSKPVTLLSLPTPPMNKPSRKRKTAPLPRRSPHRMQGAHRDSTPSETSSASSPSPRAFFSDLGTRNHSFSSASSSSTLFDTSNIRGVSHLFESSCRSPFDNPIHLRGLGQMVAVLPSTVS